MDFGEADGGGERVHAQRSRADPIRLTFLSLVTQTQRQNKTLRQTRTVAPYRRGSERQKPLRTRRNVDDCARNTGKLRREWIVVESNTAG